MLSSLGREARRLPVIRATVRRAAATALDCHLTSRQCRVFGSADLCGFEFNFDDRRQPDEVDKVERGAIGKGAAQNLAATGQAWRWAGSKGIWERSASPLRVFEAVEGLKLAATGLWQHWASSLALSGSPPFVFPGFGLSAPLPRSLEGDQGYEQEEEEVAEDVTRGLFEGSAWATSVKRKRVTKMRKHKWRKRRRAARQSAARRK